MTDTPQPKETLRGILRDLDNGHWDCKVECLQKEVNLEAEARLNTYYSQQILDEFYALLAEYPVASANRHAQRIRDRVEEIRKQQLGRKVAHEQRLGTPKANIKQVAHRSAGGTK